MSNPRIVITGVSAVTPYGFDHQLLWQQVLAGVSALRPLSGFGVKHLRCRVGGQFPAFDSKAQLGVKLANQIDPFAAYAITAARQAIEQAGLLENQEPAWAQEEERSWRVGIALGNALGGWDYAERALRGLWSVGPRAMGAFMATAWFPAAAQGQQSIALQVKGSGRTFLGDRASGAFALMDAALWLQQGQADLVLAGGIEAPFSGYAVLAVETSGLLSSHPADDAPLAYCPFDQTHSGLVLGEGAAVLVLERAEEAERRGARIWGELAGWAESFDAYDLVQPAPDGKRYAATMLEALERAQVHVDEVDAVFASGSAVPEEDVSEATAIALALGDRVAHIPVTAPKAAFGNLFGAALPVDAVLALQAMQTGILPGTCNLSQLAPGCEQLALVRAPCKPERLDTLLLLARGMGGNNTALVLRRWR